MAAEPVRRAGLRTHAVSRYAEPVQRAPSRAVPPARLLPPRVVDESTLRRGRLLDFLHSHVPKRATLVTAPAGYGKTTLLAQFAGEIDALVAWCTLDEASQDGRVLLAYLVEAVARQAPGFGQRTLQLLDSLAAGADIDELQQIRVAAGLFVTELEEDLRDFLVLTLDDCHQVSGSVTAGAALDTLLSRLPGHCHLMMSGRSLPDVPASVGLIARRQVARLEQSDLALRPEETGELAKRAGVPTITKSQAEELHALTQGWPMAVTLLAPHAGSFDNAPPALPAERVPARATRARRSLPERVRRDLFAFLAAEVLERQPRALRSLLLWSSVLPYLEPKRCAALVGRPVDELRRLLAAAESHGLFLTQVGESYRFHDLFREFLLDTLRAQQPVRHRWLQRRASQLAEAAGELPEAVDHALAGQHFHRAARLIERAAPDVTAHGRWHTVRAWFVDLPDAALDARPSLLLLAARTEHALAGDQERALTLLRRAQVHFVDQPYRLAEVELLRGAVLGHQGRYTEASALSEQARRRLDQSAPLELLAHATYRVAVCLQRLGKHAEAYDQFTRAATLYRGTGKTAYEALASDGLGFINLQLGQLEAAGSALERARQLWLKIGNHLSLARTLNNLGVVRHHLGQFDVAREILNEAVQLSQSAQLPRVEACAWLSLGDVLLDEDAFVEAERVYGNGLRLAEQEQDPYTARYALDALGRLHRLRGNLAGAEQLVRRALYEAQEARSLHEEGCYLRSLALIYLDRREQARALDTFDAALDRLSRSHVSAELARLRLYRAEAATVARRPKQAMDELSALAEVLASLGYYGFLLADARRSRNVLERGVGRGVGGNRLVALLRDATGPDASASPQPSDDGLSQDVTHDQGDDVVPITSFPQLDAVSLGQSALRVNKRTVTEAEWRRSKCKELFFYLLCHPTWRSRSQVVAALWPATTEAAGSSAFHTNVHRLRRIIHKNAIELRNGRYRLHPRITCWFDVVEFERRCLSINNSAPRLNHVAHALHLYRGPFLDDLHAEWSYPLRARLESLFLAVAIQAGRAYAEQGDYSKALQLAQKALAISDYLTPAHELAMVCYTLMGQPEAALHHYQVYVEVLRLESHAQPAPELIELYQRLLRSTSIRARFAVPAPPVPKTALLEPLPGEHAVFPVESQAT